VQTVLVDVGTLAGSLAAILGCCLLVSRLRAVRWVWRTMIADPLAGWQREQVEHVVEPIVAEVRAELRPNGGSSAYDEFVRRLDKIEHGTCRRLDELEGRTERHASLLARVAHALNVPVATEDETHDGTD
jgi:hypothetical protein